MNAGMKCLCGAELQQLKNKLDGIHTSLCSLYALTEITREAMKDEPHVPAVYGISHLLSITADELSDAISGITNTGTTATP